MRNCSARSWMVLGIALLVIFGLTASRSASAMHFLAVPQSDDDKKHDDDKDKKDDSDSKHHDDDGKNDHDMDGMHHSGDSHHHGNPGGTPPPPPPPPPTSQGPLTVNTCPSGTLTAGGADVDLDLSGHMCTVGGVVSTYIFHNVNIHDGGILRFLDQQIDFYAENILIENLGTLRAGEAPDLPIGTAGGKLTIHLYGKSTDPGATCKSDPITCGVPSTTWTNSNSATVCVPPTIPLPGGVVDCFYKYSNLDDGDLSNAYFGHKVLAVSYGGTLQLRGRDGVDPLANIDADPSNTGYSWKRLDGSLIPGAEVLHVPGSVNWQKNDHIVVTTTDYLPGHSEELIITEPPTHEPLLNQTTIHFTTNPDGVTAQGLKWHHYGQRFPIPAADVTKLGLSFNHVDTRAAVALLSRSIRIISEGETAVANSFPPTVGNFYGGHTLVRQGFASFQVQGVEFYLMGQGGDITHYPVHFHMARKTPQPVTVDGPAVTYVKDCSVHDSMTRWYTIHATQGVTLQRNVGYLSIGHGYYLEDGTEINNKIYANIGIFARAAIINPQNPRQVPGILASPGEPTAEIVPYHSDYDHPAVFWIMNGWNDFKYNMAAGASGCGVCYWLLPGANSGPSRNQKWDSYASEQIDLAHAGETPLKSFVGNTCTTAMSSFQTVGNTSACLAVGNIPDGQHLIPVNNTKAPPHLIPGPVPPGGLIPNPNYYPLVNGGNRLPTQCNLADCSAIPRCGGTLGVPEQTCAVTTLDHYTTSFSWAQTNFGAVWLRLWWYLVTDSAITDVQNGGLNFITGGGYTRSDAAVGFWSLVRKTAFIGNTQPNVAGTQFPVNPYAANAGPFNPDALACDVNRTDYCASNAEGIALDVVPFSSGQRLFSVYDGPSFQDSNGFFNIHATRVDSDCKPTGPAGGVCLSSRWVASHAQGILRGLSPQTNTQCYMPNAAIAWKQPNGFYYPPAFHSTNLVFNSVDIRHFVVEPLFLPGTSTFDPTAAETRYCTWSNDMFKSFTDIDRQTELSDDDGSLTGLLANPPGPTQRETISVNEDAFFNAPVETPECASDDHPQGVAATAPPATARTSPYEYPTLAMQPVCSIGDEHHICNTSELQAQCDEGMLQDPPDLTYCNGNWGKSCTTWDSSNNGANSPCFGVPLYREYVTATEGLNARPAIKMLGQGSGQRSTLTVNHGRYFVDTTIPYADQQASFGNVTKFSPSVFLRNQTYYFFLVYAKPSTQQTYDIFVGSGANPADVIAGFKPCRVGIDDSNYSCNAPAMGDLPFATATTSDYNATSGILTIHVDISGYGTEFTNDRKNFCAPPTYCQWTGTDAAGSCGCKPNTDCKDNSVCAWGVKDTDCPTKGCFGFALTLPEQFSTGPKPGIPPAPKLFSSDPNAAKNWAVPFDNVPATKSGAQCRYPSPPQ